MYRFCHAILCAIFIFTGAGLEALHRDNLLIYANASDEKQVCDHLIDLATIHNEHNPNCPIPRALFPEIPFGYYKHLPKVGPPCPGCGQSLPFLGYFGVSRGLEFEFSSGSLCFQAQYSGENPSCRCYWPEYSQQAATISDTAYELFDDLFSTTALAGKLATIEGRFNLGCSNLSRHGVISTLIMRKFHFKDYYLLCRNIEAYAKCTFTHREVLKIQDRLDAIVDRLYSLFFKVYSECYAQHPHAKIADRLTYMKHLANDFSDGFPFVDGHPKEQLIDAPGLQEKRIDYAGASALDQHLEMGVLFNDLKLYESALAELSEAIPTKLYSRPPYDPLSAGPLYHLESRRVVFIERAIARFELDQIDQALNSYRVAVKASAFPQFVALEEFYRIPNFPLLKRHLKGPLRTKAIGLSKEKIEFATGLILGATEGANISIKEFLPSLCSSVSGLMNGLWAFACAPAEVSEELIETAIAIGEFISSNSASECLQCVVPEIRELARTWHTLNDTARGRKIGFIIGKYGVDIFMPIGIVKGVSKVRALTRANAMLTLERISATEACQATICDKILEWAEASVDLRETRRIIPKNGNAMCHIMQKKHDWHKLVPLSGDVEKDFAKVAELLEESEIYHEMYMIKKPIEFSTEDWQLRKTVHRKCLSGHTVEAEFITYAGDERTTFLQDAWVVKE